MIKFVYLDRHWANIKHHYYEGLDDLWSQGKVVYEDLNVVDLIKQHTNRKYVTLTNSCTDAITMMIEATVKPGSEIICPAYSYYATASAITRAGCKPVFVDVDENYHINLDKVDVGPNTKGLIYVSLFGNPMDYEAVKDFCKTNNIICFEDAAQSFGASYNKVKSGSAGLCSALSFSPSKPSPTFGFLGAMATDDNMLFNQVNDAKKHGINNGSVGLNSNPSSALVLQLQHSMKLNEMCQQHRTDHAKAYDEGLKDIVTIPPRRGKCSWSKYVIRTAHRNKLMNFLTQQKIQTKIHYVKLLPQYKMYHKHKLYPVASKLAETSLSLPIDPWMTNSERDIVIDCVRQCFK